jgi:hypothetical protein
VAEESMKEKRKQEENDTMMYVQLSPGGTMKEYGRSKALSGTMSVAAFPIVSCSLPFLSVLDPWVPALVSFSRMPLVGQVFTATTGYSGVQQTPKVSQTYSSHHLWPRH